MILYFTLPNRSLNMKIKNDGLAIIIAYNNKIKCNIKV